MHWFRRVGIAVVVSFVILVVPGALMLEKRWSRRYAFALNVGS
jgi:hypothetical protein